MRLLSIFVVALLVACGGQREIANEVIQETRLVIKSERLVGSTIEIDGRPFYVSKDMLTPYNEGIRGARDREDESLEIITMMVDPGERRVVVKRGGTVLKSQAMHFSNGQTRVLRLRQ